MTDLPKSICTNCGHDSHCGSKLNNKDIKDNPFIKEDAIICNKCKCSKCYVENKE